MDNKKLEMLVMRDNAEKYTQHKNAISDLPAKIAIVGKSQLSGKTNMLGNIMTRPEFYGNDFKGENIYIVSPSIRTHKLQSIIKYKEIPECNLFYEYNAEQLMALYEILQEEFEEDDKKEHKIIIFDDIGFDKNIKKRNDNIIDLLACNGRHYLISCVVLIQKYTQLSTTFRENLTSCMIFCCSHKQLELICDEHNTNSNKKVFIKTFHEATAKPHDFFTIDYTKHLNNGRYKHNLTDILII